MENIEQKFLKERLEKFSLEWGMSAANPKTEPLFRKILETIQPKKVLEIGTFQGLSAAILAEYAKKVITLDVWPHRIRFGIWETLGVFEKIESVAFQRSAERDSFILTQAGNADLCFIDGSHLLPDVSRDFDLCQQSGCPFLLLHDYWGSDLSWGDISYFVDRLSLKKYDIQKTIPFALVKVRGSGK